MLFAIISFTIGCGLGLFLSRRCILILFSFYYYFHYSGSILFAILFSFTVLAADWIAWAASRCSRFRAGYFYCPDAVIHGNIIGAFRALAATPSSTSAATLCYPRWATASGPSRCSRATSGSSSTPGSRRSATPFPASSLSRATCGSSGTRLLSRPAPHWQASPRSAGCSLSAAIRRSRTSRASEGSGASAASSMAMRRRTARAALVG